MKLSFYGADQCVTGSCHCLEVNGKQHPDRLRLAAGTGRGEQRGPALPSRQSIDFVLVTHAHIDHYRPDPHAGQAGLPGPHPHHPC